MIPKYSSQQKHDTLVPIVVTIAVTLLGVWSIGKLKPVLVKWSTQELIAAAAVVVAGINTTVQIALKNIDFALSKKTRMGLDATVSDTVTRLSCSIECLGRKRITPKNIYLFIEKGRRADDGLYSFPYLLKHEEGEEDCLLSKRCKAGGIHEFPRDLAPESYDSEFKPMAITLKHLSRQSILFIDPGEVFREDVTVELTTPGVYRATLVFTATDADCMCTTRQFLVPSPVSATIVECVGIEHA